MEILRNVTQINEKLIDLFGFKEEDLENFLNEIMDDELIKKTVENIGNLNDKKAELNSLRELIFQLQEYITPLCNLVKMLLYSKNYDLIYELITKIFVGQIGNIRYQSKTATNFTERYFDRFIEIVKNCKISSEAYIPFIASIFKTEKLDGIALWKRPALEYLQNFYNENEDWLLKFINSNPEQKYGILEAIVQFNTMKGVALLIDNFTNEQFEEELEHSLQIIKEHKRDILNYMDREMVSADEDKLVKFTQIMLAMDNDPEVVSRLKDLFDRTTLDKVKELISNKWGISETMNIKTEKQFLNAVRRKIKEPQERSLGVPFDNFHVKLKSGYPADNAVYTFIIYLFKEEKNLNNLEKLKILKTNILDEESLHEFAYKMFKVLSSKPDINQAKWCIRMFCLFADEELLKEIFEFLIELFKQGRNKEGRYLTLCLIHCGYKDIVNVFKRLLAIQNEYISENLDFFINELSRVTNCDKNELLDMLVPDVFTENEYNKQKLRLYDAFISGRLYTKDEFKHLFIDNPIYNELAKNLVFGEYKFGRLHNAFIVEDKQIKYLIGQALPEQEIEGIDGKVGIGIIHSLDCDFRYEKIFNYYDNPPFTQFKSINFDVADANRSNISVNRFIGTFVDAHKFIDMMKRYGFKINKTDEEIEFSSMVHEMPTLNLLTEVEFESKQTENSSTATLGAIRFYNLESTMKAKDKYITQKSNALSISAIPYRFYDFVLSAVYFSSIK